ncbi:tetratricopeptide repeat domain-containing protein [Seiridium cupressi]|uniref:ER membrane protein complex subunit 2 n=1 Tax=Seiridium unicorne TaxID=138068 RepID=A0ABR2UDV1_9PEZI
MSSSLLRPPSHLPPATALQLSQQAPKIIKEAPGAVSTSVLQSLFSASETPELWTIYENLLLSCLRTGDEESAHQCLGRLINRFGDDNERIMAFIGLLKEADAEDNATLEVVLKEYQAILEKNPTNIPIAKRRVALLRSLGRVSDAIAALISLLDFSPTDNEAWSELSDMYFSQGLYSQAIFALEEVLVLQPNAWNIHARLGELLLMAAKSTQQNDASRQRIEALKRFSRSVELCDDYLRGFYGLKLTTKQLLGEPQKTTKQSDDDGLSSPDAATLRQLDELATGKLAEITRKFSAGEKGWQGYDEAEIAAAKELLEKDSGATIR